MARLLFIQLVAGIFTLSLQMTSADVVSVHPGENVTLVCSITNYSDIFWFQVTSEELKLVLSAKRGKLDNLFSLSYSVNESHFDVTQNSSLMITGLKETDLGSYYCGAQNTTRVQLGKRITLKFTGKSLSSLTCCSDTNTNYPAEKEMNLRYATFIHQREPAEKNTLDLGGVIYAGIRHLPA
ncbi:uncharacterized protein LOC125145771 isoform X2 [Tachysurus fulvidraco]|uniref:uncharacterized protein LOC125145771 isoform X2 n=1 Tax=Tachysurus fulvidraco TaxID=1234273 RepID=UPI001FED7399|nr:uncharacterized protein LOC125145771 isoform X2 [Tachysurus fulvidraco]